MLNDRFLRMDAFQGCSRTSKRWVFSAFFAGFFAFAGIGQPEKFYRTCREAGLTILGTRDFPDHHFFHARELNELRDEAEKLTARLLTTEKDWVRLPADFRDQVTALPVTLIFDRPGEVKDLLAAAKRA